uniref:Uncharacterized protein n=1 Tax=Siphoviridae sp. ct6bU4 TaxID=2825344 RepID=A0A8S5VAR6_9CAUD|nr:MAG TPA: hypothetical protein [Siphoviridae sp. ct6bU4]
MRVYIRTSNQNTNGILFHNGQTWEQEHTHCQGFTYKPAKSPTRRYEFKPPIQRNRARTARTVTRRLLKVHREMRDPRYRYNQRRPRTHNTA